MQAAYKAQETNQVGRSLLTEVGHSVVVWSPELLDLSRKQVGIQKIEPRHFAMLFDQQYLDRDQSETIFNDQTGQPRELVRVTKTALSCAVEISIQYGARGMVILDSFLDQSQAAVRAFEDRLAALGWFTAEKLDDLVRILAEVETSTPAEREAVAALSQAISTAINFRSAYATEMMGEAQRSREGGTGRSAFTVVERQYLEEIGFSVPENIAPLDARKAAESTGVQPEIAALIQANNEALVSVMADAMNNLARTFLGGRNEENREGGKTAE